MKCLNRRHIGTNVSALLLIFGLMLRRPTRRLLFVCFIRAGNLEERISILTHDVCALEEKLKKADERMRSLAEGKGQEWVGMLDAAG